MPRMTRVICLAADKGGVGKTTATASLGVAFARRGFRTLLIDLARQGNLTSRFLPQSDDRPETGHLLLGRASLSECVLPTRHEGLSIAPSGGHLVGATTTLSKLPKGQGRELRLLRGLEGELAGYDYALIDTSPAMDIGTVNALCAADDLLVPFVADADAFDGLMRVLRIRPTLAEFGVVPPRFLGALQLAYDRRESIHAHKRVQVAKTVGEHLLDTIVRYSATFKTATEWRTDIFDYESQHEPKSKRKGTVDIEAAASEILDRVALSNDMAATAARSA